MAVPFSKFHGFGNDYIVIDRAALDDGVDLSRLAISICHRHTGVGGDGIAVVEQLGTDDDADYFCEIINPDGSTAGFSGNGTRCAVAYLYYKDQWTEPRLRLRTRSGVKIFDLVDNPSPTEFWFDADIGAPRFGSSEVPVATNAPVASVIDEPISVGQREYLFSAVNVGNPVACVFVDDFNFDWRTDGRELEVHPMFPEKANIVFVKPVDTENIEIKIWERAAGETAASGTCSSGSAILSAVRGLTGRKVRVHSEGGVTNVLWCDDDTIVITGRADLAFSGEWPI